MASSLKWITRPTIQNDLTARSIEIHVEVIEYAYIRDGALQIRVRVTCAYKILDANVREVRCSSA
jgi:hypothetical protein